MDKAAAAKQRAAKTLMKVLLGGAGVAAVGGAGAAGHYVGMRRGANRTANAMAGAFAEANARENAQMASAFSLANKKENRMIAGEYMRRGYALGRRSSAVNSAGIPAVKTAEDIQTMAFADELQKLGYDVEELEKLGFPVGALMSVGRGIGKSLGKSFGSLSKLKGSVIRTAGKGAITEKGVSATTSKTLGRNLRGLGTSVRQSGVALGTIGGAGALTYGAGRSAGSRRRG